MKFVDEYWLALTLAATEASTYPRLTLSDTEGTTMGGPAPAQTLFNLAPFAGRPEEAVGIRLSLDQGGHRPSPEEDLYAPFYPDPSQRVLVLVLPKRTACFVVRTEVLLKLTREWGGANLEWEQWRTHTEYIQYRSILTPWVSGPRVLSLSPESFLRDDDALVHVSSYITRTPRNRHAEPKYLPIRSKLYLPSSWDGCIVRFFWGGHDSLAFLMVNTS